MPRTDTTVARILTRLNPAKLKKHPKSLEIYGEQSDEGFDESVASRGVDEPIVVAGDGKTIISGVRRCNAAIKAKLAEVPIIERRDLTDDLDIREAIVEANRHNEQTTEVKARAFRELKTIEAERAAKRRNSTLKRGNSPVQANLPEPEKGQSRDKAAVKVGMKPRTAEKAAKVVAAIDKAEASGNEKKATDLRETLNKSVSAAHRKVAKKKPAKGQEKPSAAKLVDDLMRRHFSGLSGLPQAIDAVAKANGGRGALYKSADDALNDFLKAAKKMRGGAK